MTEARKSSDTARSKFYDLDVGVPHAEKRKWLGQEQEAKADRHIDLTRMDIYDVGLRKGMFQSVAVCDYLLTSHEAPTLQGVELGILETMAKIGDIQRGAATWLTKGLKIQQAQITLGSDVGRIGPHSTELQKLAVVRRADKLSAEISGFFAEAPAYLTEAYYDDRQIDSLGRDSQAEHMEEINEFMDKRPEQVSLPLPSNLGIQRCKGLGAEPLVALELSLRVGQANDALHEIRLALADKAVLFRTEVRHSKSQARSTRAWGKVHAADAIVTRHCKMYRTCRTAMVALGADEELLSRYELLRDEDLKVSTAVVMPNSRDHRNASLAWFWTMDIPRDTEMNDWMSECKSRSVRRIYQ